MSKKNVLQRMAGSKRRSRSGGQLRGSASGGAEALVRDGRKGDEAGTTDTRRRLSRDRKTENDNASK